MMQLIWLEWKKNRLSKYIGKVVVIALLQAAFLCALIFGGIANDLNGTLDAAPGTDIVSAPLELFTSMAYLVLTSTMLASFIVSAYQNKTMNLMFSYPIKRQKILAAQMIAVFIFCFAALVLTKLFLYAVIAAGAAKMEYFFAIDYDLKSPAFYGQLFGKSFALISLSFIALFVGLAMKSSKAAIITSFFLILLTQANIADFTLANNWFLPIVLTIISFLFAVMAICKVESRDVT